MSARTVTYIMMAIVSLILYSCGGSEFNGGEDYGNILETPGGLTLTEEEHPAGWGRSDCTSCHNLGNIHLVDRTGLNINIDQIHNDAIQDGISGCANCHGGNGV